jgi:hypothetical protein
MQINPILQYATGLSVSNMKLTYRADIDYVDMGSLHIYLTDMGCHGMETEHLH